MFINHVFWVHFIHSIVCVNFLIFLSFFPHFKTGQDEFLGVSFEEISPPNTLVLDYLGTGIYM